MGSAIQTCPMEVLDLIMKELSCSSFSDKSAICDIPPSSITQEFAAYSASCRVLSAVARPYLFKSTKLSDSIRAQQLLDFISSEARIARWIERLTIVARHSVSRRRRESPRSLLTWLAKPTAVPLMTHLRHLKEVEITLCQISNKDQVGNDDLIEAWNSVMHLQPIKSLILKDCYIPSWDHAIKLVGNPHLESIVMDNSEVLEVPESIVESSHLPHLLVHANISSLRLGVLDSGYQIHHFLIGQLRCTNLVHLDLTPIYGHGFEYAHPLLRHAPNLRSLFLRECAWELKHLCLDSQPQLQHIAFHDVNGYHEPEDIAQILPRLINPAALKLIEIIGWFDETDDESWQVLDQCLSGSRFVCNAGDRALIIRHTDDEDYNEKIDEQNFSRSRELGWFKISLP